MEVFLIAIGLAMDAFSVSIAIGALKRKVDLGTYFRVCLTFAFFQFLMPLIGYFLGASVEKYICEYDHWVAFILLTYIGIKMIIEALNSNNQKIRNDPTRGVSLFVLAVATSIDALAVGLSYGVLGKAIWLPALIIGLVCLFFCAFGLYFGKKIQKVLGKKVDIIGGVILIMIGVKILMEHTLLK